ncbi:MAG TPA: hypothetical protein VNZ52_07675 [Candidatus Thermoplasmatota archaeon]|nr:hypothetical protein [Candidatus Thermoplasmatota archaeon]
MTASPTEPSPKEAPVPKWVYWFGAAAGLLLLVVIVRHLVAGGAGGHL